MSYDYLEHHGILGQKWGVRRFQNRDGSYTDAGARRHAADERGDGHARSAKATFYRTASKVYGLNERTYKKSNKTLASMNAAAKNEMLKKAENAQKDADTKRQNKIDAKNKKVDAYRQKLADKAIKRAEKESELSKRDMRDAKDLRKNGTKSEAYKQWAKAQLKGSESEGFLSKSAQLAMTAKFDVADLMGQKIRSSDEHKAKAKSYIAKNNHLMNLNINDQKVSKLNLTVDYYLGHYKK